MFWFSRPVAQNAKERQGLLGNFWPAPLNIFEISGGPSAALKVERSAFSTGGTGSVLSLPAIAGWLRIFGMKKGQTFRN